MNQARLPSRFLAILILVAILAACSSPPPPAEEAPAADAPAVAEASGATAESGDAAPADEYRAQREQCTWENPCWPHIVDTVPAAFSEAPMLAEKVAAGELPPVEERLPAEPLVIEPAEMIGQYSDVWRRAFTGPGDRQNIERMNNDYAIFWDASATERVPRLLKAWEANEDSTVWTHYLREGTKWSDGEPLTADDYLFWYEQKR